MPVSHRRAPRGYPRRNSVHKRSKSVPGVSYRPFVYTITVTRGYLRHNSVHKRPKLAQRAPILPSVYTIAATRGRPRHNSVHKRPKPARRDLILPFVYTIAATRGSPQPNSVHKRPNPTLGGSYHPSVYTPAVPWSPKKADRYLGRTCLQARGPGCRRGAESDGDNQRSRRHGRCAIEKQLQRPRAWQTCAGVFGLLCPFREMTKAVGLRTHAGPASCGISSLNAPGFEWGA